MLMDKYRLMGRQEAVRAMHFPKDLAEYKQALRRTKFEELFYFQMNLQVLKAENKFETNGLAIAYDEAKIKAKIAELPFPLTEAQQRSLSEILADMKSGAHMNRLLQGDVGSGKTVIASLAMYGAYTAGLQSALMVPTEILAEQHYQSLQGLFPELEVVLLTSGMKAADKKVALSKIESGEAQMIVGTHSLIQDAVTYHRLGLVITDEQHRFGVNQRRIFREKGDNPDVLMMTATPIPRTLAITAFGEMDVSIIDQMPAGRKPIITRWVKHEQLDTVLAWIKGELEKMLRSIFISPLIEESEALDLKNAVALHQELTDFFGDSARVALMHGRMTNDEKDQIMQDFKDKKSQILVSTTVIEVGVNVPNATVMVIMDADRFGLSQLHQLRGRVGRGHKQSYCVLVANPKNDTGKKRMQAMCETTDGFVLAEEDLKMRGSGEIFGTRQSGIPEFQVADIVEDYNILEEARRVASQIVSDPNWRENPDWQVLGAHLSLIEEKTPLKNRFFCYLASFISYDVRSPVLFFRLHLDLFITELAKLIEGKTDFHTLYLYSLLISLVCSVLLIMYVGFIAQLIIHIQHQKERTLLPVWCMLTAVLMLVPLFEDFSILGSSWNFKGVFSFHSCLHCLSLYKATQGY